MRRRELLLLASAMTAARPLRAQPVIGFLSSVSAESTAFRVTAFRQGLSETGYVEGQNLAIEYRWAEGRYDRLPRSVPETPTRRWSKADSNRRSLPVHELVSQARNANASQATRMVSNASST